MGLLGAAKNIYFLVGFLKLEETSKYTDFNPVFSVKLYNFKVSQNLRSPLTYAGWGHVHLPTGLSTFATTSKLSHPQAVMGCS